MLEREWRAQAEQILQEEKDVRLKPDPQGKYNLVVPRSACPKCGTQITAAQNIPVISYLVLGGKCAKCGAKISVRYPVVELGTAILSAVVAWKFGFVWYTAAALLLTWMLIALTGIDIDHQLLPDTMTRPLVWIGLLLSLATAIPAIGLPVDPRSSIIGAVAGYLSLWSVYHAFRLLTGKEGMGYGEFKLFAALGAWLGWQMLLPVVLGASAVGAVVGLAMKLTASLREGRYVPFGPFLAGGGLVVLFAGRETVLSWLGWAA